MERADDNLQADAERLAGLLSADCPPRLVDAPVFLMQATRDDQHKITPERVGELFFQAAVAQTEDPEMVEKLMGIRPQIIGLPEVGEVAEELQGLQAFLDSRARILALLWPCNLVNELRYRRAYKDMVRRYFSPRHELALSTYSDSAEVIAEDMAKGILETMQKLVRAALALYEREVESVES